MRGNKVQLSILLAPELANELDAAAKQEHMSRSALLTMVINNWLRQRRS
jgi:metal-responsive CopG/Arc/MetJ family transcriptional regulator